MTLRFARGLFLAAGTYGFGVVAPLFFIEERLGTSFPPPINHPEFYYGFACVTLAWQVVYWMMWRDPLRLRPMLVPAVMGKAGFAIAALVLFGQGRLEAPALVLPGVDLVLAVLFVWAYIGLARHPWPPGAAAPGPRDKP